jgi:hypothetical protein
MKKNLASFFSLLFLLSTQLYAQKIDSTLAKYADDYQQEKIHIHFDKGIYNKGETVWFKAYVLTGLDLSDYSKNFYVDWFDDKGTLIRHSVSPMFEATAKGKFDIPNDYKGKFLHVKAYTQWMLNFDTAFLYNKDIKVDQVASVFGSKEEGKKASKTNKEDAAAGTPPKTHTATIQFFPEGGVLLNGVVNKIAFLINNEFGLPVSAVGALRNNKGEFIDSFITEHDGMGSFTIQPDSTQPVTATWLDQYGATHYNRLPLGVENSAGLQVEPTRSKAIFFVNKSAGAGENFNTMYVIASMHQHEVYKSRINLSSRLSAIGEVLTTDLPTGVLQITLFDANYSPIAERVVFVNNYKFLFTPEIRFTKKGLDKRQKNTIEIEVDDSLLSNMSVSITDANLLTDAGHNIVSDLLLSGDIKGNINNPAYYFTSKEDSVFRHLDLVMLTHGWRKFNWKEVAEGKLPYIINPKETDYMQLKGTIFGNLNRSSMQNQTIFCILQAKDSSKQSLFLPVDRSGNFLQKGVMFYDTVRVFYQLTGSKSVTDRVEIRFQNGLLQAPSNKYSTVTASPFLWNYDIKDTGLLERSRMFYHEKEKIEKRLAEHELAEVTVRTTTKRAVDVLDEKYTSGLFAGGDSRQFDLTTDPFAASATSVFQYLQGRVAGLQITDNGADVSLSWRGSTPDLYLDEIPTQVDVVRTLSMNDIAYVKVFPPPFFGPTSGGAGGAISIYTRKGEDVKLAPGQGLNNQLLSGYTPYKEFYSPNYETTTPDYVEDARTTLYWNPYILTNGKTKTVQIEFFNNDISKRLRFVLEGVNMDGKLARIEKIIE